MTIALIVGCWLVFFGFVTKYRVAHAALTARRQEARRNANGFIPSELLFFEFCMAFGGGALLMVTLLLVGFWLSNTVGK